MSSTASLTNVQSPTKVYKIEVYSLCQDAIAKTKSNFDGYFDDANTEHMFGNITREQKVIQHLETDQVKNKILDQYPNTYQADRIDFYIRHMQTTIFFIYHTDFENKKS